MKTNIPNTPQQYNQFDVSQKIANNVIRYCELTPKTLRLSVAKLCLMGDDYTYTIKEIPYDELFYNTNNKKIEIYTKYHFVSDILFSVSIKLTAFVHKNIESRKTLVLCLNVSNKENQKATLTLRFLNPLHSSFSDGFLK